jgi:hypothetical protein
LILNQVFLGGHLEMQLHPGKTATWIWSRHKKTAHGGAEIRKI